MVLDIIMSWVFPAQCIWVSIDCIISMCRKPKRVALMHVKVDNGKITCKLDKNELLRCEQ